MRRKLQIQIQTWEDTEVTYVNMLCAVWVIIITKPMGVSCQGE